MLSKLLLISLTTLFSSVFCDLEIESPLAGASYTGTGTIPVKWTDNGDYPEMKDITAMSFLLCTGSNSDIECFYTAAQNQNPATLNGQYNLAVTPARSKASNGQFFIQVYCATKDGGHAIHYSERFTLTGMTGTLKASSGEDEGAPPPELAFNNPDAAGAGANDQSKYIELAKTPYLSQTGRTRYAPVQLQAGSSVNRKLTASRRYPTSSVSLRQTWTERPIVLTTITPSPTYSMTQAVNWAGYKPDPTGYYAASEALSRTINAKSRRGYVDL